ncbi:MAG: YciI family protein [Candidatus Eiseniibacteriota bacterium]
MSDDRKPHEDDPGRPALEGWGAAWRPPASLREDTLRAARARGLVGGRRMNRWSLWVGAAAAAVLLFVAGFGLGSQRVPGAPEETNVASTKGSTAGEAAAPDAPTGPLFALFLFEDKGYQQPTPDALGARIGEYSSWARSIGESGRYVTGEKLADDGSFCRLEKGALTASGPVHDSTRGVLAGYFIIGAASLEEARSIARNCPHLKYGGSVEIRRLETT